MSLRQTTAQRLVTVDEMHCDGPNHVGETLMEYDTITVSHRYGSPHDTERQDFCSMQCARDWFANPTEIAGNVL